MEAPTPQTVEERKRCPACRRDAPITFYTEGNNACNCCAERAPPLPEWIDAKLVKRAARVLCECGAKLTPSAIAQHRETSIHRRVVAQLSQRDPTFAAEVEAKEATRAEAARVMTERMNANAKAHIANRELSRIQREAMTPQELTPEEVAAREWLRVRKEIRRVAAGLPAVEPPKPRMYECPDCKSCITNNKNCIKTHRRTLKHLNAIKAATTA